MLLKTTLKFILFLVRKRRKRFGSDTIPQVSTSSMCSAGVSFISSDQSSARPIEASKILPDSLIGAKSPGNKVH